MRQNKSPNCLKDSKVSFEVPRQVSRVHSNNPKINVRIVAAPNLKARNSSIEATPAIKNEAVIRQKKTEKMEIISNDPVDEDFLQIQDNEEEIGPVDDEEEDEGFVQNGGTAVTDLKLMDEMGQY